MSLLWVVQSQTQFIKPSPACGWIGLFMWRGCASRGGSRRHITMPRRLFINSHALTVYSHFSFVSLQRSRQFLKPRTPHICNRPVCISLRALESCRSLERVSACSHLFWLYKCRNPLLVPAWQKKKKRGPNFQHKKALGLSRSTAVTFHCCHSIYPSQTLNALMKLGQTQPDENLQIGAHTHIKIRAKHTSEAACVILIELWCDARGGAGALVSSALAWEAAPSTSLLTYKSYGNCRASLLSPFSLCLPLSLSLSLSLSLFLSLSLHHFLSCGCNRPPSVQRKKVSSSDSSSSSSSSSRERCKEPRGAPMAPHSHLLSPSPFTTSHTPTPNPSLCLSPCPCPSPHAGPQSTRTRRSGGRRCPATPSRPPPWTCARGTCRMTVRSLCLKTGRWPTQRPAWCIS